MVPRPIRQNGQVQRLTTALKNICRDYPAGGTVLRELLQNADDAGATEVRFILDEKTYPVEDPAQELIDPDLEQYQGPALLAYNNAVFTDTDFENLSRLGDSLKLHDGSTTGKFGRGFNSVYNWTDSPSIVSREQLLILDPHCRWSKGGPVYDFVENNGDVAIQKHMSAFRTVMKHLDRRLDGTIIRIPLRTQAQAADSEISDRQTTVSEVLEVLRSFASEFGENGLLFMRNIERLEIGSASMSIEIELTDAKALRLHKSKVNKAVNCALKDPTYIFDHSFEVGIEYRAIGESKKTLFAVHHRIQCIKNTLRVWAEKQNLIPWVAVAARLPVQASDTVNGSLFTVLPLPIATNQPVHIHGQFSLSPDRARLYQFSDKSAQDQDPAAWNTWLLEDPVPAAWTRLLSYLAGVYPEQSTFEKWPQNLYDAKNPLSNALEKVLGIIEAQSLVLWPTDVGFKSAKDALLGTGAESNLLRNALREAQAPVVNVPERLQNISENIFKDRILSPQSLCAFLRGVNTQIKFWSSQTKQAILEYLLSKPGFIDYDDLDLFPFKDGTYRSIGKSIAYVHRDNIEEALFNLEDFCNLDLGKLSISTQQALRRGCETLKIHPSIRYRTSSCLKKYCMSTIFRVANDQDFIVLDKVAAETVAKVWTWISRRGIHILDPDISCLWLLPSSNGRHRRVRPAQLTSEVYFAPPGEGGDLMMKFDAKMFLKPLPLLDVGQPGVAPVFLSMITNSEDVMSTLLVKDARRMVFLLRWIQLTWDLVDNITDEERLLIVKLVALHSHHELPEVDRRASVKSLSHLPIFRRVSWNAVGDKMVSALTWTNLICCSKTIGLLDGIKPVPDIDNVQFVAAAWSSPSSQLLQNLALGECLRSVRLIQDHIIPAWESDQARKWTSSCKEQMAEFILGQFSLLSLDFQSRLRKIPIVPVSRLDGNATSTFAMATNLIDPTIPELKSLCFDDEGIRPKENFLLKFNAALKGCGLNTSVDEAFVEQRIRHYASTKHSLQEIQKRATNLLQSTCRWTSPFENHAGSDLQCLKWLPVVDVSGALSLKASYECRGRKDLLLVGSQLPILNMAISGEWERRLGWHGLLPSHILLSQLKFGVQTKDREVVDAVLSYLSQNDLAEKLISSLTKIACVLTSNGMFVIPSHTFRPPTRSITGCERLQPYLANVDNKFWQDHKDILIKLNVGDQLQLADLLKVQEILEAKSTLEESDVAVAIETVNLASKFRGASLAGLKIISGTGEFYPIQNINYDDLGPLKSKEKVNLTHPDIPLRTIQRLGIGGLRERLIKGMLEIEDVDDEDEFDQRENVTTRIADTLDRYPVEATFREYLANADDTEGASCISWLLDQRAHPVDKLLTPEMKLFQGPAFLVHNDGVFSENDFEGFKNVGEGSKAHDKAKIGQFGRGSQTMYHWTDVPMILSGRYLLILDPQQEVLPRNQIKGKRKPGVKLLLSKLRDACGDQLVPFEGLWNYTQGLDNYPGTIFRFPLRKAIGSSLRNSTKILTENEVCRLMDMYFNEARISLLFLRRVRSISFGIQGQPESGWSVTRLQPLDEDLDLFSQSVICQVKKKPIFGTHVSGKDKWWVAFEDLRPEADRLPESSRRVMKNVECGIAALISSTIDSHGSSTIPPKPSLSRMFNTLPLPLPISSDLPVHVHATFSLSGDRQSIAVDDYGTKSPGASWNRFLLKEALPKLYLSFLDDIGQQVRQRVFSFWPQEDPPKGSCAELLCASFWEQVPHSSQRLFPKAIPTLETPQRGPPKLLDIKQAVFDFLPRYQSDSLTPLLMAMDVNLVRDVPKEVVKHLKAILGVNSVKGLMMRTLLKSEKGRVCLLKEMARNPHILRVLFELIIPTNAELHELDGCHVLPLADGTLATLKFENTNNAHSSTYFLVSAEELKLFDFASRRLIKTSIGTILEPLLESGKFNVARLKLCDVRKLLEMKPAVSSSSTDEDIWMADFWKYWNRDIDSSLPLSNIDTLGAKIFRAALKDTPFYVSPASFQGLPAVVEPVDSAHKELCDKIPGLWRFNTEFMPKSLADKEKSFYNAASLYRFIRALRVLSGPSGIGTFVKTHLGTDNLKILRDIIIAHLKSGILSREPNEFIGLGTNLKSIPLWPKFQASPSDQLISANDSLIAGDSRLLVPWMKECGRFILASFSSDTQNQNCLLMLGVRKLPIEVLLRDYVLPMPSILSDTQLQYYQPLISGIFGSTVSLDSLDSILTDCNIAADGNRKLKKASELYDHEDQIFVSAFRHQQNERFLHKSVEYYRPFWLRLGLRYRASNFIIASDYIQCLQVLKARLTAENTQNHLQLEQDSRTILAPLIAPNSSTQRFGDRDWRVIAQERVFRSRSNFNTEPEYRRNKMAILANDEKFLRLSDIVLSEYAAVCWTQTSFVTHQPTKEVLVQVPGHGKPSISMVLQHLQTMKILSEDLEQHQVRSFLVDLNQTYEYLQDHIEESRANFNLGKSAIWLNLETSDHTNVRLEDIDSSWQGIEHLVLSSSVDAGPIKAVRPGLMRFEKLLRGLGCSSITYPTVTRPTLHLGSSVSKSLRQLRNQEKLLDITYSTEGRRIKAHKVVLAAMSEMCAHQFNTERWRQEDVISYDETTDPEGYMSYHTLSTMINYAYEEEINWKEMEVSDDDDEDARAAKLDLLLDLHKGADYWLVPALKSEVEDKILVAGKAFVNLSNVMQVKERAEEVRALVFAEWCTAMIADNQHIVDKAHNGA
ncbi:hypothetical protein N431DRAFT_474055 [Stipitochalara longipes BDJ]|nr:hypothetical protein N431DRAFT_474055 [Stipitochalara longipes BDJ]